MSPGLQIGGPGSVVDDPPEVAGVTTVAVEVGPVVGGVDGGVDGGVEAEVAVVPVVVGVAVVVVSVVGVVGAVVDVEGVAVGLVSVGAVDPGLVVDVLVVDSVGVTVSSVVDVVATSIAGAAGERAERSAGARVISTSIRHTPVMPAIPRLPRRIDIPPASKPPPYVSARPAR